MERTTRDEIRDWERGEGHSQIEVMVKLSTLQWLWKRIEEKFFKRDRPVDRAPTEGDRPARNRSLERAPTGRKEE